MAFSLWNNESPALSWQAAAAPFSYQPKTEDELLSQIAPLMRARGPASDPAMALQPDKIVNPDPMAATIPKIVRPANAQPGDYAGATTKSDTRREVIDQSTIPVDPATIRANLEAAANMPQIQEQRKGIEALSELAKSNLNMPAQLDLSPLLGLTDSWTGSKLSQNYQRPATPEERAKQGFAYAADIQKRREDLADKIRELAKDYRNGGIKLEKYIEGGNTTTTQGFKAPPPRNTNPQVNNPAEKIWTEFQKTNKKNFEAIQAGQEARTLVGQGTTVADQMLKRELIRLSGDQRPSDKDVDAFGGDSRLLNRVQQFWDSKFDTGTFSDLNRGQMMNVIGGLEAVANKRLSESVGGFVESSKDFHPGIDTGAVKRGIEGRIRGLAPKQKPNLDQMAGAARKPGPSVGDVVKGYRYKGGNPADKNNWEKTQ